MEKGIKSSEFWLGLIALILTYLNKELGWNVPVEAIISVLGLVATYIIGRTIYKVAGIKMGYGKKK